MGPEHEPLWRWQDLGFSLSEKCSTGGGSPSALCHATMPREVLAYVGRRLSFINKTAWAQLQKISMCMALHVMKLHQWQGMLDRKEKKHGELILNLLDFNRKGDVLSFLAPSVREAESCISDCGKVNNIMDISWKIEKSKQVGITSSSHAFFKNYTESS